MDKALATSDPNILTIKEGTPRPEPSKHPRNPTHGRNFILWHITPGFDKNKQVWSLRPSPVANNFKLVQLPNNPLPSPLPMSMYAEENRFGDIPSIFEGTDQSMNDYLRIGIYGRYSSAPEEYGQLEGAFYCLKMGKEFSEKGAWKWHEETGVEHLYYKGEHMSSARGHCNGEFGLGYGPPWSKQVRFSLSLSLSLSLSFSFSLSVTRAFVRSFFPL